MSAKCSHLNDDNTVPIGDCRLPIAECQEPHDARATIANTFDPDQTRSSDGTFSAEAADATSAAHKATAEAYTAGTAEGHERAAKLHRVAAMRQAEHGHNHHAALLEAIAREGVKQTRHNMREDNFAVRIPTANITDDPAFPFEAQIVVRTGRTSQAGADNSFSGGVTKFSGKRVGLTAAADASKVGVTYEFLGPWYDLANTHFLQTFKGSAVNPAAPGEIILNTGLTPNGTLLFISAGDQIQGILQWLLDQYAAQGMREEMLLLSLEREKPL